MSRLRRNATETSNHPFRSLFELMLALVFMLLAFIKLHQPKPRIPVNSQISMDELLLLHSVHNRLQNDSAPLITDVNQLPHTDLCFAIAAKRGELSDTEKQALEQHRTSLWNEPGVKESLKKHLLSRPIIHLFSEKGQDRIFFPTGDDKPENPDDANHAIDWIKEQLDQAHQDKRVITMIRIEGHTDNTQFDLKKKPRYKDNWALSAARASWLAKQVETKLANTPYHNILIEPIGYADQIPVSPGTDTREYLGRADNKQIRSLNSNKDKQRQNRRIRIVLEED